MNPTFSDALTGNSNTHVYKPQLLSLLKVAFLNGKTQWHNLNKCPNYHHSGSHNVSFQRALKIHHRHITHQALWSRNRMFNWTTINIAERTYAWQGHGSPSGPCFFQEAPAGWQSGIFPRAMVPFGPSENQRMSAPYGSVSPGSHQADTCCK